MRALTAPARTSATRCGPGRRRHHRSRSRKSPRVARLHEDVRGVPLPASASAEAADLEARVRESDGRGRAGEHFSTVVVYLAPLYTLPPSVAPLFRLARVRGAISRQTSESTRLRRTSSPITSSRSTPPRARSAGPLGSGRQGGSLRSLEWDSVASHLPIYTPRGAILSFGYTFQRLPALGGLERTAGSSRDFSQSATGARIGPEPATAVSPAFRIGFGLLPRYIFAAITSWLRISTT